MRKRLSVYLLALKYFLSGDPWSFAVSYAKALVYGFQGGRK